MIKIAYVILLLPLAQLPRNSSGGAGGGGGGVVPPFADQTACEQGIVDDEIASPECVAQAIAAQCSLAVKKEVEYVPACQNTIGGVPSNLLGDPTYPGDANTPAPRCYYGTATTFATLVFDSAQVGQFTSKHFRLLPTFSSVKAIIMSRTSSTTGTDAVWKLSNTCVAAGSGMGTGTVPGAGSGGPASYGNDDLITVVSGSANVNLESAETTLDTTGCSAGNIFMWKLELDATNAATDPELIELILRNY